MESMRGLRAPLLCELHAHTTWSDGELTLRQLVDLYGTSGFDVLCVTDHALRTDDPWGAASGNHHVDADAYPRYLRAIEREAERARALYDLLVIPGLELTYADDDPGEAAHAVAVGLRSHVSLDDGLERALRAAREQGAALIAALAYTLEEARRTERGTARFAEDLAWAAEHVDRFEIFNRHDFFACVASARLPAVATGDFHRPEHLMTWKTLLPCAKHEQAVLRYLCSGRPAYLAPLGARDRRLAA